MITIIEKPELQPDKSGVWVKLSNQTTAYLGTRNYAALSVGDDESKFNLTSKPRKDGDGITQFIDPKNAPRSGGGGGFKGAPKDEMSIVAQTIVKEAVETARQEAARKNTDLNHERLEMVAAQLTNAYQTTYQKLKGANGC